MPNYTVKIREFQSAEFTYQVEAEDEHDAERIAEDIHFDHTGMMHERTYQNMFQFDYHETNAVEG